MLSQKQDVVGPVVIAPGATEQVVLKAPGNGSVKGVHVGDGARAVKLFVGKERFEVPADSGPSIKVDFPMKMGGLLMLTVENTSEEPGLYSVAFDLEIEEPDAVPPPKAALALRQALPSGDVTTTPEQHGVKPGANEIAAVFFRSELQALLSHMREGHPLTHVVKFGIIRRLDALLKPKKG